MGKKESEDLSLQKLLKTTDGAIHEVTWDNWDGIINMQNPLKKLYWEKDEVVADVIDEIIVNLNSDSEAWSDTEDSSASTEESNWCS